MQPRTRGPKREACPAPAPPGGPSRAVPAAESLLRASHRPRRPRVGPPVGSPLTHRPPRPAGPGRPLLAQAAGCRSGRPPPGWKVEAARAHLQVVHAGQAELHRAGGERIPPAAAASPLPQAPVTAATSGGGPHRPEAGSHGLGLAARRRARGEPRAAIGQRLPEGAGPRLAAAVWRPEERPEARRRAARVPPPVTWVSK